jgi:phage anti-repressor protein
LERTDAERTAAIHPDKLRRRGDEPVADQGRAQGLPATQRLVSHSIGGAYGAAGATLEKAGRICENEKELKMKRSILPNGLRLPYLILRDIGNPRIELPSPFQMARVPKEITKPCHFTGSDLTSPWPAKLEFVSLIEALYRSIMSWFRDNQPDDWAKHLHHRKGVEAFLDGAPQEKFTRSEKAPRGHRPEHGRGEPSGEKHAPETPPHEEPRQESYQADPPPESEPIEQHMNALVPVFMHEIAGQQVQATNLRELHGKLGKPHRDFSTWIKLRIEQYGFGEGRDFTTQEVLDGRNSRTEYYGTLSMGKELAMVENNDRGKMIRKYFIAAEEQFRLGLRGGGDFTRIEQMLERSQDRAQQRTEGMFEKFGVLLVQSIERVLTAVASRDHEGAEDEHEESNVVHLDPSLYGVLEPDWNMFTKLENEVITGPVDVAAGKKGVAKDIGVLTKGKYGLSGKRLPSVLMYLGIWHGFKEKTIRGENRWVPIVNPKYRHWFKLRPVSVRSDRSGRWFWAWGFTDAGRDEIKSFYPAIRAWCLAGGRGDNRQPGLF